MVTVSLLNKIVQKPIANLKLIRNDIVKKYNLVVKELDYDNDKYLQ